MSLSCYARHRVARNRPSPGCTEHSHASDSVFSSWHYQRHTPISARPRGRAALSTQDLDLLPGEGRVMDTPAGIPEGEIGSSSVTNNFRLCWSAVLATAGASSPVRACSYSRQHTHLHWRVCARLAVLRVISLDVTTSGACRPRCARECARLRLGCVDVMRICRNGAHVGRRDARLRGHHLFISFDCG